MAHSSLVGVAAISLARPPRPVLLAQQLLPVLLAWLLSPTTMKRGVHALVSAHRLPRHTPRRRAPLRRALRSCLVPPLELLPPVLLPPVLLPQLWPPTLLVQLLLRASACRGLQTCTPGVSFGTWVGLAGVGRWKLMCSWRYT